MAKTELTKQIESALSAWNPTKIGGVVINKMRASVDAYEVTAECGTTKFGLVDYISVQESQEKYRHCGVCARSGHWSTPQHIDRLKQEAGCDKKIETDVAASTQPCDNLKCKNYRQLTVWDCGILITCVEIKVTKADFKSKHGHNFIGHCNFYAMPKSLYPEVKDLIPDDIGVLLYYDGSGGTTSNKNGGTQYPYKGIRKAKDCKYHELSDTDQKWIILSVYKRAIKTEKKLTRAAKDSQQEAEEDLFLLKQQIRRNNERS